MSGIGISEEASREDLRLLIMLRWIAVAGQVVTVAAVHILMGVVLPLGWMLAVLCGLVLWNIVSSMRWRAGRPIAGVELFAGLMVDVLALTAQLYLSGGASNPFISIFLLQVILGTVLLEVRWAALLAAATTAAFVILTFVHQPLDVPRLHEGRVSLHVMGMFLCFILTAGLLLIFLARIAANQRVRDFKLAELKRRAAEEDHVVRMGLLAAGAAHELGTPLATLSVILNDWKRSELLRKDADAREELQTMLTQLERCKIIVSGILQSSGELRGEGTVRTTVRGFLDEAAADWASLHPTARLDYRNAFQPDRAVVADMALKQVVANLLENARETDADAIALTAVRANDVLQITVEDNGPGFDDAILDRLGQPYLTTKSKPGSGLGLFLVVNVVRKLGGAVSAENLKGGGARVTLRLPLDALGAAS